MDEYPFLRFKGMLSLQRLFEKGLATNDGDSSPGVLRGLNEEAARDGAGGIEKKFGAPIRVPNFLIVLCRLRFIMSRQVNPLMLLQLSQEHRAPRVF